MRIERRKVIIQSKKVVIGFFSLKNDNQRAESLGSQNKHNFLLIDDPWPAIRVDLSIKRISWLDRKIVVLPLILVSCLTLATFWTHPSSGNRILLGKLKFRNNNSNQLQNSFYVFTLTGCFNLLVVILLLLEVQARLPQAGAQLPLVASFAGNESLKDK